MSDVTADVDLVMAAKAGDVASLGALVIRHRPAMEATALSLLGPGPDAEDAVQDAVLAALQRIATLRDPGAVRPWLQSIVRNNCRMHLRSARPAGVPVDELLLPSVDPSPEQMIERQATRDWVWHALSGLTEPLRTVALLRYFSEASTYQEIAGLCDVPVGTVRSRLSQARTKLTEALTATATERHSSIAALRGAQWRDAGEVLTAAHHGRFGDVLKDSWLPEVRTTGPAGERGVGRDFLARAMDADMSHGVRHTLRNVAASGDVRIWETDLSVADTDYCCATSVVWLQRLEKGQVRSLRLFHPGAGSMSP